MLRYLSKVARDSVHRLVTLYHETKSHIFYQITSYPSMSLITIMLIFECQKAFQFRTLASSFTSDLACVGPPYCLGVLRYQHTYISRANDVAHVCGDYRLSIAIQPPNEILSVKHLSVSSAR